MEMSNSYFKYIAMQISA